ncbi:MAG: glycosyltransferase [Burkholderiales bacterium]|nr:glycosyltransferase [Burkholderiales bacterium]
MVKRVLLVAFQFPPMSGTSGVQRTLRFAQHLPRFGWEPIVLTAHPRAYPEVSADQLADVPAHVPVKRAFALDSATHLALAGRYPKIIAMPDRWISWWCGAVPSGLGLIRKYRPQAIWSTYPIATAHVVAMTLSRLCALPWIADFRDSMTEAEYPRDPATRKWFQRIERKTVEHCTKAVFTTPGAIRMYSSRYPAIPSDRFALIENGYDEASFAGTEPRPRSEQVRRARLKLVHSGVIYPTERDPTQFFAALAELRDRGRIGAHSVRIVLRAPGHETYLNGLIAEQRVADLVEIAPAVAYRDALGEMQDADGLLVLQGADCNHQIPAKVYEYLRAGRPILGLADPRGDTAAVLRGAGIDTIAALESKDAMVAALDRFIALLHNGDAPLPERAVVASHTRENRAMLLGRVLDGVCLGTNAMPAAQRRTPA